VSPSRRAHWGWVPSDAVACSVELLAGEWCGLVRRFDCRPVVLVPSLLLTHTRSCPYVSDCIDRCNREAAIKKVLRFLMRYVETSPEEVFRRCRQVVTPSGLPVE
jgi:hypothetical protein